MNFKYSIRLIFTFLLICVSASGHSQETFLARSKDGIQEYYLIDRPLKRGYSVNGQRQFVEAWVRNKPAADKIAEFRRDEIATRKSISSPTKGFETLSYALEKFQFDCEGKTMRIVSVTYYNSKGQVLDTKTVSDHEGEWIELIPNSIGEIMGSYICEYAEISIVK